MAQPTVCGLTDTTDAGLGKEEGGGTERQSFVLRSIYRRNDGRCNIDSRWDIDGSYLLCCEVLYVNTPVLLSKSEARSNGIGPTKTVLLIDTAVWAVGMSP